MGQTYSAGMDRREQPCAAENEPDGKTRKLRSKGVKAPVLGIHQTSPLQAPTIRPHRPLSGCVPGSSDSPTIL